MSLCESMTKVMDDVDSRLQKVRVLKRVLRGDVNP